LLSLAAAQPVRRGVRGVLGDRIDGHGRGVARREPMTALGFDEIIFRVPDGPRCGRHPGLVG